MSDKKFSWELFYKAPIVGIVRNLSMEVVKEILPLYREAGLTTIEITMNTPGATDMIRYARSNEGKGLNIGAGTVCTKDELEKALEAGAQFIVTPILDKKVVKACIKQKVPVFPGAYTPSEIYKTWALGAPVVKVFPATVLGPEYIKDILGPLDQLKLMPTGGVSLENMDQFLKAGAVGLGIGGQLFDKTLIQNQDWEGLLAHFKSFVAKL
ncbi:MAG TPA: bifunctional 4-hydroxy-2-oxoglutarate aldolase/2-dehydro-3-deoxy-phosphogluconate aldolase [Dyadobacter sp.]|jgi:2-dehydro-3-deoxyphosphogluconate aldolase/(4S)-4-hydroxy-2-oxoglutarate aldolase|nr:bifunctional 4-hydroxy-2-oxoglutarate aldolase/2-dehydro-3-deoxy-phosphogluconate aldolase [Dyadobacter sp.]